MLQRIHPLRASPTSTVEFWEDAAKFYAKTFPDSGVTAVHTAPGDFPAGKQGQVLTVEFTALGVPCLGLNGGPAFKHSEAWQITPKVVSDAITDPDAAAAKRAFEAMMKMKKIDIATIESARRGSARPA